MDPLEIIATSTAQLLPTLIQIGSLALTVATVLFALKQAWMFFQDLSMGDISDTDWDKYDADEAGRYERGEMGSYEAHEYRQSVDNRNNS